MKGRIANGVLWAAFLLAMGASVSHVAWAFNTLEPAGFRWNGWLAAVAVDAGLAALAYGIQNRKRAKRRAADLWLGVGAFTLISAFANFLHALGAGAGTWADVRAVEPLTLIKAVLLSASLPLLVVYLGEVVSSDDVAEAERRQADLERAEARAARLEARAKAEAERLEREAAAQAEAERRAAERTCARCGFVAGSQHALNAHMRVHSNGRAVVGEPERAIGG